MVNADFKKFEELLKTDKEFQEKLQAAAENYTGEPSEEAVFENLLLPLGQEYGLSATFEEFQSYISGFAGAEGGELSEEELAQVAGGKGGGGAGIGFCLIVGTGIGAGGAPDDSTGIGGGLCAMIGLGWGGYECWGSGQSGDI